MKRHRGTISFDEPPERELFRLSSVLRTMHCRRSTRLLLGSVPERDHSRVSVWRSLGFAAVVLFAACAGCDYSDMGPAPATVSVVVPAMTPGAVATIAVAPARGPSCRSDANCGADPTGGLCLPKAVTNELADAEDFLARAMRLDDLITRLGDSSSSSELTAIRKRVREDVSAYGRATQERGADGGSAVAQGVPLTSAQVQEMQDAAWMPCGATQADWSIQPFAQALSAAPVTTDAQKVHADITGLDVDHVISDLQTFLQDIEVAVAPVDSLISLREADGSPLTPKSGAGALLLYLGPVMKEIEDARSRVAALLGPSAISQRRTGLRSLSRAHDRLGKDGKSGTCLSL